MTYGDEIDQEVRQEGHYERVAIACLLAYPQAIDTVRHWLEPEDFTWPVHRAIYDAALRLHDRAEPVDHTSVLAELQRSGHPDPEHRLVAYMLDMPEHVAPVAMSAAYHCKVVLERSVRRELIAAGVRLQQLGERGIGTPDELLAEADRIVERMHNVRTRWSYSDTSRRAADEAGVQLRDGQLVGVHTERRTETLPTLDDYRE